MDLITEKDVEYVAKLARVAVSDEEKKTYQQQLAKIFGYMSQLKEKNTDQVPITAHPFEVKNVWREDVAHRFEAIPELLVNAPEKEETFFRVKKVIE